MTSEGEGDSVEQALENALDDVENREAEYWIRTALQRLLFDREGPDWELQDEE